MSDVMPAIINDICRPIHQLHQPFKRRDNMLRIYSCRASVSLISFFSQFSEHCNRVEPSLRKWKYISFVLQQNDSLLCGLKRQLPDLSLLQSFSFFRFHGNPFKGFHGPDNAQCRIVDHRLRNKPPAYCFHQFFTKVLGVCHFNRLACQRSCDCILHAPGKIADEESLKSPLLLQDIMKQISVMSAHHTIVGVIGTHHSSCMISADTFLKMTQEYFPFCPEAVAAYIHAEALVFHLIEGEMFQTGDDADALNTSDHSATHLSEQKVIFPVRFLRPSPSRVIEEINTDPAKEIGSELLRLLRNRHPDFLLQVRIESGCPNHRNRETGGFPPAADNTSRSVTESDLRHMEPVIASRRVGLFIIMFR